MWCNPYNNFNTTTLTTQLSLSYNSTVYGTDLYNIPQDSTIAPIFFNTLDIIPQRRQAFHRSWYKDTQSLLLYPIVYKYAHFSIKNILLVLG